MDSAVITLCVLCVAGFFFATELIPLAVTAMGSAIVLGLFGVLTPAQVYSGLSNSTVVLFAGMFVIGAAMFQTGLAQKIGVTVVKKAGTDEKKLMLALMVITIILVMSAMFSALVDNIPFAATMIPVVRSLATQGLDLHMMAWALSLGTDLGGNATPIGASANVVGTSVSAKSGHPITWGRYCKVAVPGTIMVVGISLVCLLLRVI